jgi:hypothetical protein
VPGRGVAGFRKPFGGECYVALNMFEPSAITVADIPFGE